MKVNNFKISSNLLFILMPLLALIYSLKHYGNKWAKNILWFFCAFFGYAFQIMPWYQGDAARYKDAFLQWHSEGITYSDVFRNLFSNNQNMEILQKLIAISVGKFTLEYHILYLVYGALFGYCLSRNLAYIYKFGIEGKLRLNMVLFLSLFFIIPIWNINGFDFWMACQLFIYGTLPLICEGKRNYILILAFTPLVHFSFYLPVFLLTLFYFIRNYKGYLLFYAFALSFLFTQIDVSFFGTFINNFMPSLIVQRSDAYINAVENDHSGGRILALIEVLFKLSNYILAGVLFKYRFSAINSNKLGMELFNLSFFFLACFNTLSIIPSMHRFVLLGNWLLVFTLLYNFYTAVDVSYKDLHIRLLRKVFIIHLVFWIVIFVRYCLPIMGVTSILSNPFLINLFVDNDFVFRIF